MTNPSIQSDPGCETRERILDAAEALFTELGFAATSLRAIASAADVNLAATNYHFGSKMGLLQAVVHRRVQPINEMRLQRLGQLQESGRTPTTRSILEAFVMPLVDGIEDQAIPALVGRVLSEPDAITRPIMEQAFLEVLRAFREALADVLPDLAPEELAWRFHFVIGSMIHLLHFDAPIGEASSNNNLTESVIRLIDFSTAGLEQHRGAIAHA
jgi:AcrR family transcriptional regulator